MSSRQVKIGDDGHRVDVYRDSKGVPRCNARLTTRDGRCINRPILGRMRCRKHGGATPIGAASPHHKDGSTSRYREVLGIPRPDPDDASMLDVRGGVQVQEEIIARLAERLSAGDTPKFRDMLRERVQNLETYLVGVLDQLMAEESGADLQPALQSIDGILDLIAKGIEDDKLLSKLSDAAYKLSSQVEGAHRARTNAINSVNLADAQRFFTCIVKIVREEVGAKHAQRVLERVDREVLGARAGGDQEGGGRIVEADGTVVP